LPAADDQAASRGAGIVVIIPASGRSPAWSIQCVRPSETSSTESKTQGAQLNRRSMVLLSPRSCQHFAATAAAALQCPAVSPGAGPAMKQDKGWSHGAFKDSRCGTGPAIDGASLAALVPTACRCRRRRSARSRPDDEAGQGLEPWGFLATIFPY
jgi:hypothetical protein